MKIYTKTGDDGTTGIYGGPRLLKDDPRIEAYGAVDELNAVLGVVRTLPLSDDMDALLEQLQNELFDVGAELATPDPLAKGLATIAQDQILRIEAAIDEHESRLTPLREFILPGGSPASAHLHLARTVCRRAERHVVTLAQRPGTSVRQELIIYLNRLSDLLFVLARAANVAAGQPDVAWRKGLRDKD